MCCLFFRHNHNDKRSNFLPDLEPIMVGPVQIACR
jgi:hypothetical protein